jgi:uncharacterized protein (TIGR00369 family)
LVTADAYTPRPVKDSQAIMTELMMPHMANLQGSVFGGVILSLIDRVAAVAAIRHCAGPAVTVSVDQVDFREPIHVGEFVVAKASVNYVGRTSMEVGVRVEAEQIVTRQRRHTNSCYLTFVALDDEGHPTDVPQVEPEGWDQMRRYEAAKERRQNRTKRTS